MRRLAAHCEKVLRPLLVAALLAGVGCAWKGPKNPVADGFNGVKQKVGLASKEDKPRVPTRVVSSWTNTVLNQSGKKPQRGFGGRLSFFNDDSEDPIRVAGRLVVYAFNETDQQTSQMQATRRYIFPADQLAKHESDTALGPSYSFWLPWDEEGGPMKQISLIVRFEPEGGAALLGEQTRHLLPGTSGPADQPVSPFSGTNVQTAQLVPEVAPQSAVRQTSAAEDNPAEKLKQRMQVATIPLPGKK